MNAHDQVLRRRAENSRRAWIAAGVSLLFCSAVWCWILVDEDRSRAETMERARHAHPGSTICFAGDPLRDVKLTVCEVNAALGLAVFLRGLVIRTPRV